LAVIWNTSTSTTYPPSHQTNTCSPFSFEAVVPSSGSFPSYIPSLEGAFPTPYISPIIASRLL
jgi:hypothetical protein